MYNIVNPIIPGWLSFLSSPPCSVITRMGVTAAELREQSVRETEEHYHHLPALVSGALVLGGTFINLSCVLFEHCVLCHAIPELIINDYFLFQLC